jgi:hypothetical protein
MAFGVLPGQHLCRGAIGHQRAIGALQRSGHERISFPLLTGRTIAGNPQLRAGIGDAVLVVLAAIIASVGLIAVFLK